MIPSSKDSGAAKRSQARAARQEKQAAPTTSRAVMNKPGVKTKAHANPGNGHAHSHRTGNGHGTARTAAVAAKAAPAPMTRSQRRKAAAFAAAAAGANAGQVRYNEGLRYGSGIHYVTDDPPVTPVQGTAKVKLELSARTDPALAAFGESNKLAMAGNPFFPSPLPVPLVFDGKLTEYETILSDLENLRLEVKNLTEQKNRIRKEFEVLFNQRGDYVQLASNGNADVIASAGLPIRNPRTPVGVLPAPLGLRLELTLVNGEILARWDTVAGARNYLLECAEIVSGEELVWVQATVSGKLSYLTKQLTQGKRYAFRVAAMGGADGRSAWSPVVERMAA